MTETQLTEPQNQEKAPHVSLAQIEEIAKRVMFVGGHMPDTTVTVMHALLDGVFYLGSAHSACVSKENFDEEQGIDIAQRKLSALVRDKLWELEGYRLYCDSQQIAD
jgi:hypothetical protein